MTAEKVDLKPSKETYRAIKADVNPVSSIMELIDNALDNWKRVSEQQDDIQIEVEYDRGSEEITIRDNSGGIERDKINILFALGESKKEDIPGSIGAYGIGAKKAIVNLGNEATIKSRARGADKGYGFTIDEEWLNSDEEWEVTREEHDIPEGVTEIQIRDLNIDWGQYEDDLHEVLSDTYEYFLSEEFQKGKGQLSISINGRELEPPEPTDWGYSPIDGTYPRRYENIRLEFDDMSNPVYLHVTVGLIRRVLGGNESGSGADIFCQGRKILSNVKDERAGFGEGTGNNRLNKYSAGQRRLRFIIELETEGDTQKLPWDAQKSNIDPYNKVAQAALNWVRRIVRPYQRISDDYESYPSSFLRPYDEDCQHSNKTGIQQPEDYEDRQRLISKHKPDTNLPEAKDLRKRIDAHLTLGITSTENIHEELVPAYESALGRIASQEKDIDPDTLTEIEDTGNLENILSGLSRSNVEEAINAAISESVEGRAKEHAELGVYLTELDAWLVPKYEELLKENLDDETGLEDLDRMTEEEIEKYKRERQQEEDGDSDDQTEIGDTEEEGTDGEETEEEVEESDEEEEPSGGTESEQDSEADNDEKSVTEEIEETIRGESEGPEEGEVRDAVDEVKNSIVELDNLISEYDEIPESVGEILRELETESQVETENFIISFRGH